MRMFGHLTELLLEIRRRVLPPVPFQPLALTIFIGEGQMHKIAMLGTGLIGRFYTMSLLNFRGKDEIKVVYSARESQAQKFADDGYCQGTGPEAPRHCLGSDQSANTGKPSHHNLRQEIPKERGECGPQRLLRERSRHQVPLLRS